eukprot:COSAG01_NODE_145_length_24103_cov_41.178012_4_plen_102_part_00
MARTHIIKSVESGSIHIKVFWLTLKSTPAQQHAKSQISPMVRPRASNEGAFDRHASRSTQLKHRLVALASSSLRYMYVTVARRYGLFDCSDFFRPYRIDRF